MQLNGLFCIVVFYNQVISKTEQVVELKEPWTLSRSMMFVQAKPVQPGEIRLLMFVSHFNGAHKRMAGAAYSQSSVVKAVD